VDAIGDRLLPRTHGARHVTLSSFNTVRRGCDSRTSRLASRYRAANRLSCERRQLESGQERHQLGARAGSRRTQCHHVAQPVRHPRSPRHPCLHHSAELPPNETSVSLGFSEFRFIRVTAEPMPHGAALVHVTSSTTPTFPTAKRAGAAQTWPRSPARSRRSA